MYAHSSFPNEMAELNNHGLWWWELSNNNELITMAVVSISVVIFTTFWYKFIFSSQSISPPLPPGPRSLPIVGYLPFLSPDLHKQFTTMATIYGPIFKFHVGKKLHVIINNPEIVKAVVRDQDHVFANRSLTIATSIYSYGAKNIAFSNNSYWRNLRKIFVQEVLNNKNLEASSCFRRHEVRKTVKNVYSKVGTTVNIREISFSTSMNVMTSLLGGTTLGVEDSHLVAELQITASRCFDLIGRPNVSDFFPSLAWFDLQGIEKGMKKQHEKLDQIITAVIDNRIKYSSSKKIDDGIVHQGNNKDFLQVLLELNDQKLINLTQIKGLMLDTLIGGTDTTTTIIEWAMTEIMKNRNIMKRVHEELDRVVGVNNIVEESHLSKLEYLDATIKETLRLHPVGAILVPRSPSQDCVVAGYTIPKGSVVSVNVWAIQRDPQYWDNPTEFIPERFLTCEGQTKWDFRGTNLSFLPFGSGRRLCPGIPLAEKMQMYILASFLHSFDWSLPNGEKHDLTEKLAFGLKKGNPLIVIPSQRLPNSTLYM